MKSKKYGFLYDQAEVHTDCEELPIVSFRSETPHCNSCDDDRECGLDDMPMCCCKHYTELQDMLKELGFDENTEDASELRRAKNELQRRLYKKYS